MPELILEQDSNIVKYTNKLNSPYSNAIGSLVVDDTVSKKDISNCAENNIDIDTTFSKLGIAA